MKGKQRNPETLRHGNGNKIAFSAVSSFLGVLIFLMTFPVFVFADGNHNTEINIYSGITFPNLSVTTQPCFVCAVPVPVDLFPIPPFTTQTELSHSFLFGVKVGQYLNRNIEVEGNFSLAPHQHLRQVSGIFCPPNQICPLTPFFLNDQNIVSYFYDGDFVYNFLTGSVRPYAIFGIGGISTSMQQNNVQQNSSTDFTLIYGGGAKFYFNKIGVRFEINDHLIPNNFLTAKTEHYVQVQYGFLFQL